jgi:hypothetical protein
MFCAFLFNYTPDVNKDTISLCKAQIIRHFGCNFHVQGNKNYCILEQDKSTHIAMVTTQVILLAAVCNNS